MLKRTMQEIALYRKYRPKKWSDVLGQDNIVKVIESSVKLKRISHAYLFTGDRGTGKTSVARILASDIGCKEEDLYEIDAASNRGIDDIREIKQSVSALPFRSPYKVYIVDEVHMLTKDACNALLKTLEEPPAYIVFILATTEPEKLPETVISRCQVFNFKRPSQNILKEMVLNIARKENFTLEPASAELVALLSEGSFRDAQGILQKVINSSKDKKISLEEVELVTGAPKNELVNDFVKALAGKDVKGGLQAISVAAQQNLDMKVFLKLILQKVRFVLLIRLKAGLDKEIESEVRKEDFEFLKELSGQKGFNINSNTLYELLDTHDKIGRSYIPQLPLELVLVKLSQQEK
ncbi:MAG: DNA polymerase III, subunit gamma and tau [Parcubacteria group bacterium Gr01-1014_107]|nr:MAG: DNA polymerase III, subunit gamma and tau [Parcubacteria group bacterium Gr01-1014_107]